MAPKVYDRYDMILVSKTWITEPHPRLINGETTPNLQGIQICSPKRNSSEVVKFQSFNVNEVVKFYLLYIVKFLDVSILTYFYY